ncbi:MAG: type IV secretion system DNA-binding domain-containing protein [Alphaproteobacteria bacterium]
MSKSNSVGNFTRGSQVITHQMRMFAQGMRASLLMGFGCMILWVFWCAWSDLSVTDLYHYVVSWWASFKLSFFSLFGGNKAYGTTMLSFYHFEFKRWMTLRAYSYLQWNVPFLAVKRVEGVFSFFFSIYFLRQLMASFCGGIVLSIGAFMYKGWKKHQKTIERGGSLVTPKTLKNLLRKKGKASDIQVDGIPLVKGAETLHMLLSGTTGAGKTNALHKLLPQIRAKGQKAIIVDLNGSFVSKYYREGKDIILNPLDQRTVHWSPWADCLMKSHYDAFAEALIPNDGTHSDKFWEKAARTVLSSTLEKLENSKKTSELCQMLLGTSIPELEEFLKGTAATYLVSSQGDKMSTSIMGSLTDHIKGLLYVQDTTTPFSIRDWMKQENDDSWLFLTAAPDQRATIRPLLTAWLDMAFNALMSLDHEKAYDLKRRVWFILDELPALQKIPSLQTALAESRKFGGCIVAGIQNMPQLYDIYKQAEAQSMMNLFNTSLIFRTDEPKTCQYLSDKLGEQEIHDVKENISYGANTIRDGVNLNSFEKRHLLVLPTEIALLPDLSCYLKYPGNWPITKIEMKLEKPESIAPTFLVQEIKTEIKYVEKPKTQFSEALSTRQEKFEFEDPLSQKKQNKEQKEEVVSVI